MRPPRSCVRWRARRREWPDEGQLSLDIGRAISAGQELRPLLARLGYGPKTFSLDQLKIGQPDNVMLEGAGSFDRVNATGKLALEFERGVARPAHRLDRAICAVAGRAAQRDGHESRPGARQTGARSRQEGAQADRANAPRRGRSRRAAAQGRHHDHREAARRGDPRHRSRSARPQRSRHRVETVVGAGPRLAGAARPRSRDRGRRGPGAIRGHGDRRMACAAAAEGEDLGRGTRCRRRRLGRAMGAGEQGQRQSEGSQRRSRAAARSQTVRHAGAEYRACPRASRSRATG